MWYLTTQYSMVICKYNVVELISRKSPSCITEILCQVISHFLAPNSYLSILHFCMFGYFNISWKWNHYDWFTNVFNVSPCCHVTGFLLKNFLITKPVPAYLSVQYLHAWYTLEAREGIGFLGTGLLNGCSWRHACWDRTQVLWKNRCS